MALSELIRSRFALLHQQSRPRHANANTGRSGEDSSLTALTIDQKDGRASSWARENG